MVTSLILGFAIRQDSFQFKFQPKVGEKIRYRLTLTDVEGHEMLPSGTKSYVVFKIAGVKDGKYTVHETSELTPPDQATQSRLFASFRVDSLLASERIMDETPTSMDLMTSLTYEILGCFYFRFTSEPMKISEEFKVPTDLPALIKKYTTKDDVDNLMGRASGEGDRVLTLVRADDKTADFKMLVKMHLRFQDTKDRTSETIGKFDVKVTVDRDTGIPTKIEDHMTIDVVAPATKETKDLIVRFTRE